MAASVDTTERLEALRVRQEQLATRRQQISEQIDLLRAAQCFPASESSGRRLDRKSLAEQATINLYDALVRAAVAHERAADLHRAMERLDVPDAAAHRIHAEHHLALAQDDFDRAARLRREMQSDDR